MTEYKATLMLRIGVLLMLSPFYLLGAASLFHGEEVDVLSLTILVVSLAIVIAVWVYYGSIKIHLNDLSLAKSNIIGKKEVKFSDDLKVYLDVRTPLGDLGNVLGKRSAKNIVSSMGSEAKLHINITLENNAHKITLDSNIKGIANIRDKLSDVLLENILPDLVSGYENGKNIVFGPISIQKGTLKLGSKQLAIEDITKIETRNRKLVIGHKGKMFSFAKIPTVKIPNLVCLVAMITSSGLK